MVLSFSISCIRLIPVTSLGKALAVGYGLVVMFVVRKTIHGSFDLLDIYFVHR